MNLMGSIFGKRLRRKQRRAIWMVVGSIGVGILLFGFETTLDDEGLSPTKFYVIGFLLVALALLQYSLLSKKNRSRKRRRHRRRTVSAGPHEHPKNLT
jgi:uncharacterized membrane protein YfcA